MMVPTLLDGGALVRVIQVAVADDDAAFRGALVDVLEADPRFAVAVAVSTGMGIGPVVVEAGADLVVLDVRMPEGGPVAASAIREAVSGSARRPVIVALSAGSATHTVVSMLRAGAVGYLVKGRIGSALPDLLARCAAGEVVLAVPCGAEALHELIRTAPPPLSGSGT
jgi:DNA-binding NarL/FixJ family response regulator